MRLPRTAVAVLALVLGCASLAAFQSASAEERLLVWSDEFDGRPGGPPDPSKWRVEEFTDPTGREKQCYTSSSENVALDGMGHLVISALEQTAQCADGVVRDYTSGFITTEGLHDWTHGRLEVRALNPSGVGTWPAFWAVGVKSPELAWPYLGEIDVMEYVAQDPRHLIGTRHGPKSEDEEWFLQRSLDTQRPLSQRFHVYAVDWSADEVAWSLDGEEYGSISREEVEKEGGWVFDRPFYLLLNLALEGILGGTISDRTRFPQQFVIDYVHVYQ
jgi:beta-glucanase (GH16 family)